MVPGIGHVLPNAYLTKKAPAVTAGAFVKTLYLVRPKESAGGTARGICRILF